MYVLSQSSFCSCRPWELGRAYCRFAFGGARKASAASPAIGQLICSNRSIRVCGVVGELDAKDKQPSARDDGSCCSTKHKPCHEQDCERAVYAAVTKRPYSRQLAHLKKLGLQTSPFALAIE